MDKVKHPEAMVCYLREQAARYRRLARATDDADTKDVLYAMSHGCEDDAEQIESEMASDAPSRRSPE